MTRPTLSLLLFAACLGAGRAEMVVVSEIRHRPSGGKPECLVLTNQTATPFDIANWRFTEGVRFEFPSFSRSAPRDSFLRAREGIVISAADPAQTRTAYGIPGDVRVFGPWAGKLNNAGERITLKDKNGVTVCSVAYGAEGLAETRSASSTSTHTNVVINEILFGPPAHLPSLEYVELFNRGSNEVDLSRWQLRDAIRFTFPAGTKLAGAGFLVVASDLTRARTVYGDIPVLGNFDGKLSNEGERVRLVDASGYLVNEVLYRSGGDWPEAVKGGGSSLELVNPWLDNSRSSAWRASDEAGKAPWRTYSATKTYLDLKPVSEASDCKELHLYLVGKGQALLQDIQLLHRGTNVLPHHASQLSTNGGGDSGWLCQGTHWASAMTNGQLHLVSDGRGDDRANRLEIDVPALQRNEAYELRFQARWLSGQPRLLAQTWDRSFTHSFLLEVAQNLGTPGRVNSRFTSVPPPQLDGLRHAPVVPRSSDTVTVSAQVLSQGTCAVVRLFHRLDDVKGSGAWLSEPMFDDGQRGGDTKAGDGIYTGKLDSYRKPGQVVQFYVTAQSGPGPVLTLPRPGPDRPALFVVDDRTLPRDLRTVRLVLSARDLDAVARGATASHRFRFPRLSNHYFNGTLIINEAEAFHGAGWRNSGSPLTREGELRKPKVKLPADQPYRGRTKFVYDDDAAEGKAYHNRMARYLLYLLGHVVNENEFVRLVINAGPVQLREEVEPVDESFLARNFRDGQRGDLYRIDDTWWLADGGEGLHEDADWSYRQSDEPGPYRGSWLKRTRETEDDFGRLIEWFKVVSTDGPEPARDDEFLDSEAILKLAAVRGFIGDWDNFTMQRGRNGYFYRRPTDGRFQLLHWDSDEGFMTGPPLYGRFLAKWIEEPCHYDGFVKYLKELFALTVEDPSRVATWLELEREATHGEVFQATYLNLFKVRAAEVREMLASPVPRSDAAKAAESARAD